MRKIVFVSRLDADCSLGAMALCEIAPRLADKYPDLEIIIVGGGTEFAQIREQSREINNKINERDPGKRFATPQEADAISKLAGSIQKLQKDVGVADIVSVGMRFLTWLRPLDPEAGKTFNNLFDAFIKDQIAR